MEINNLRDLSLLKYIKEYPHKRLNFRNSIWEINIPDEHDEETRRRR